MIRRRGAMLLGAAVGVVALLASGAEAQGGGGGTPGAGAAPGTAPVMPNGRVVAARGMRGGVRPAGGSARRGRAGAATRGSGRWGYDSGRETSVGGVVVGSRAQGAGQVISAMNIRTAEGEVRGVGLGPAWYLDHVGLEPQPGDGVVVLGAPSQAQGRGYIIAREVEWQGERYRLRGGEGEPLWAGASKGHWLQYGDTWNPDHREMIRGEICALESMTPDQPAVVAHGGTGMGRGVAVQVALRGPFQQAVRVHLGPAWFVAEELPDLELGQEITVTGSRTRDLFGPMLLAEEVQRGEHRVRLRAQNGRPAWAGGWQNWDGWGPGSRYGRMYDPQRVRTMCGVVERADMESPWENIGSGLMLTVHTRDQEQVRAHVAPGWFVDQAGIKVAPGDEVTLTGSMVGAAGEEAMMVRELQIEEQQIRVREADGIPVWIGPGPGRGGRPGVVQGRGPGVGGGGGGAGDRGRVARRGRR
jgi:hypothetical protein